jgi:S-phase kinase-associated protein 1
MFETVRNLGADGTEAVPLADVQSQTLEKILEYCNYHSPLETRTPEEVKEFDSKYMDVQDEMLFDIMRAANFLDIKGLLQLAADKVARRIVTEFADPAAVKAAFGITDDFTTAEHEELRKKEPWIVRLEAQLKG